MGAVSSGRRRRVSRQPLAPRRVGGLRRGRGLRREPHLALERRRRDRALDERGQLGRASRGEARVRDLVDGVAQHREREPDERDADPRRDEGPPRAREQGRVVARPVEVRSPGHRARVAEAEELEADLGADRVDGRRDERRRDERRHVGQELDEHDAQRPLARDDRGLDELAVAQRQRLRAEDARAPRPPCEGEHDDDARGPGRQIRRQHDRERQPRDHEEDVDEHRQHGVGAAAQVAGRDADERAHERHEQADGEADGERDARAGDGLREDVLSLPRRAEQVAPRRRQVRHGDERRRIAHDGRTRRSP